MLLEILFKDFETSVVVDIHKYGDTISTVVPFRSKATVWKHEIYFPIPIELRFSEKELMHKVERGGVYYWPPGKALCLFYGFTHSYTPVIYLGRIVDPLNALFSLGGGEIEVLIHKIDEKFASVIEMLKGLGYTVATPLRKGERVVAAYSQREDMRFSYTIVVEEYGIYVESEGLAKYRDDLATIKELQLLKEAVKDRRYSRIDISEDGYIVVTATAQSVEELPKVIKDVEATLPHIPVFVKV